MSFRFFLWCGCAILALSQVVEARNFRWSSQGDAASMDPHAQNETFNNSINELVYEALSTRGKLMETMPNLAVSWNNTAPNKWLFKLRPGVKFHDGTPFTADDVVFSFNRARESGASFKTYAAQAGTPRRIDDLTVEFTTPVPNPVMADTVASIYIMSRAWCEKNKVLKPQDFKNKEETFAVRNAMGTGAWRLQVWEAGVKILHQRNPDWWGIKEGRFEGNADSLEYRPIANAATRMAAIKSGQVDFVLDPPVQDVARLREDRELKLWEGSENRLIFLAFDQGRNELLYSDVKGRNPFKDRRVRMAMYQAIDINALKSQVMRGLSVPTAIPLQEPKLAGVPAALDVRPPLDLARARQLLADAGYAKGFGFTLSCPNDRYINDEKICVAVAAMWAKIGLEVKVETMPKSQFFPRAERRELSAYLFGWGGGASDPIFMFKPVMHSLNSAGAGAANYGDWKNEELDRLIDQLEGEMNGELRQAMINRAVKLIQEDVLVIPLHRQVIPWVSRKDVFVVHRAGNTLNPIWVKLP